MRRYQILLIASFIGLIGVGMLSTGIRGSTASQQEGSSGVTTEVLGMAQPESISGQTLYLLRVTFEPEGYVDSHTHPGTTIYHLEQGSLIFTLLEGEASLVRAGHAEDATPETLTLDEEITLAAGDTVFYDGSAVQTERNDGDADALVLISNLRGADEPAREFVHNSSQIQTWPRAY